MTSRAQVSATTENPANRWSAGTLELTTDAASSLSLSLNASEISPGLLLEDCVVVSYRGSIPDVDVRLFGQMQGDTGLARFLTATVDVGHGASSGSCSGFRADGPPIVSGGLQALARQSYKSAASIMPHAQPGDEIVVRITLEVDDDNNAQGLSADYSLVVEARP